MCQPNSAQCAWRGSRSMAAGIWFLLSRRSTTLKRSPRTPARCSVVISLAGDRRIGHRDGANTRAETPQRVQHRGIVLAIDAGLHQHRALDTERGEKLAKVIVGRVGRRVDAFAGRKEIVRLARRYAHGCRRRAPETAFAARADSVGRQRRAEHTRESVDAVTQSICAPEVFTTAVHFGISALM